MIGKIIKTWLAPKKWKPQGAFDTPSKGRIPPPLRKVGIEAFLGRKAYDAMQSLGSYGMGGPGFSGIGFVATEKRRQEWLVLTLWGADNWLIFDDKILSELGLDRNTLAQHLAGSVLREAVVQKDSCRFTFEKPSGRDSVLEITADPDRRPITLGSKEKLILAPAVHLLDAWVVCETDGEDFPYLFV